MTKNRLFTFVLLLAMSFTMLGANELPTDKNLIEGELENGFKYIIRKNAKPKNRAEFRLVVKIGSLEEDDDQKGIAHFVEHMAFNGSKHFKENELIKYLESIGLDFGSHLNASTGYERTLYKLALPLEKDNLEKGFLVFEDWAGGLSFDAKEFEKERGVILEEKRQRDSVGLRLYNQYKAMLLGKSKYLDRLTIGDTDVIKNIPLQRVKDFYNDWYRPEFMHFIAVGDFDVKEIEAKIKEHFSSLKNKSTRERASRKIAENNETRVMTVTDKELTSNSFSIEHMDPITSRRTKEDIRDGIVESMMFRLFNMKAEEQLLKNNPKATSMSLTSSEMNTLKGRYSLNVNYRGDNEKLALKELYALVWSFEKYGFSQDNLKIIKKEKLSDNEKWHETLDDRYSSSLASSLVGYTLHDSIYIDDELDYEITKELIPDIKIEEINAYYKKVINIKDRAIIFVNTSGNKFSKKEVLDLMESAKEDAEDFTKVKKLSDKILNIELNSTKILSKKFHKKGDFHEFVLANGIKVVFKKTDFSKDSVTLKAFSFGGSSLYNAKDLDNVLKSSGFIAASGAGEFSVIDVEKILADTHLSTSLSISMFTENIYASANSKDLEEMFELLYLKLTRPKVNEIIANNAKRALTYHVKQADRNPREKFHKEFSLAFFKNNKRIIFDSVESVEQLDSKKMLEIYQDRFSDMNSFTFLIIGDVETDKIEQLIAKYLGNLPTKERKEHFIDREKEHLKGEQTFSRAYNNKEITQIGLSYMSEVEYSKKRAFMNEALKSILEIRLREFIREEKSAVYGIGVNTSMSRLGKNRSTGNIYFSCEPKRAEELVAAVLAEVDKLKKEGVSKKELDTYRKKYEVNHELMLKENSYWLTKLEATYKYGTTLDYELFELDSVLEGITTEDIKTMANKIFGTDRMIAKLEPKEK